MPTALPLPQGSAGSVARLDPFTFGLEHHLNAAPRDTEITVYAAVEGEVCDLLVSLDLVVPERTEGGWVCRHCVRGAPRTGLTPRLYASPEDLWRDHLFEDFLDWVNGTLAQADTLVFYRFGGSMTAAHLLPFDGGRVQDEPPPHSFPLARLATQVCCNRQAPFNGVVPLRRPCGFAVAAGSRACPSRARNAPRSRCESCPPRGG